MVEKKSASQDKKKSLISKLFEKIDKKMKAAANSKSCCCCKGSDKS